MSKNCCSAGQPRMILACSGGSNVGQLTNQAAVELTREGFGTMFCLAGLGGGLKGLVQAAREAGQADGGVLVLDGCAVGCAKAIMNNAGLPLQDYLVVTDLGIDKVKDTQLVIRTDEVQRVKQAARGGQPQN
ncbi:MAG: zinc-binding protein [Desulfovibrionales bacterium GWA2_65_9]|nr:MAG: zinc-binding protein [Desulfovibrionales bacterium GWA2_65_9]